MTDFSDRIGAERQARDDRERATLRRALEQERDEIEAAEATYRELTPDFARQASEIGWPPCVVVATKVVDRKISTGWFSSRTMKERVFGHVLSEGWVVTDRAANMQSSGGGSINTFLVMLDGDWIALGHTAWSRLKDGDIITGLPAELYSSEIVVIDPSANGIVPYRPHPAARDAAVLLIEELLHAEGTAQKPPTLWATQARMATRVSNGIGSQTTVSARVTSMPDAVSAVTALTCGATMQTRAPAAAAAFRARL